MLYCRPALAPTSQAALTLRAVSGLIIAAIARAHGTTEPTMGARSAARWRWATPTDRLAAWRSGFDQTPPPGRAPPATRQRERAGRAHLLQITGDTTRAVALYRQAAKLTANQVEQRYLLGKASWIGTDSEGHDSRQGRLPPGPKLAPV